MRGSQLVAHVDIKVGISVTAIKFKRSYAVDSLHPNDIVSGFGKSCLYASETIVSLYFVFFIIERYIARATVMGPAHPDYFVWMFNPSS